MYRVIQTVEAFRYPAGKVWGPYLERLDAEQRIETLRERGGDGVIEYGDFGQPCVATPVVPLVPAGSAA